MLRQSRRQSSGLPARRAMAVPQVQRSASSSQDCS
jgi:hypothetical protein